MGSWICQVHLHHHGDAGGPDRTNLTTHRPTQLDALLDALRLVLDGHRHQIAAAFDHTQLCQALGLEHLAGHADPGSDRITVRGSDGNELYRMLPMPQVPRGGIRFPNPIDRYVASLSQAETQQCLTRLLEALWTPEDDPGKVPAPVEETVERINRGDRAQQQLGTLLEWLLSHFPGPHVDQAVTALTEGPAVDPTPVTRSVIAHLEQIIAPGREARAELDRLAARLAENYAGLFDPSRPPVDSTIALLNRCHDGWVQLNELSVAATRVLGEKTGQPVVADPAGPLRRLVEQYQHRVLAEAGTEAGAGSATPPLRLCPAVPDPTSQPVSAGPTGQEPDTDPQLVAELQRLGHRWGPMGVALAAARLTDTRALAGQLVGTWHLVPGSALDLTLAAGRRSDPAEPEPAEDQPAPPR